MMKEKEREKDICIKYNKAVRTHTLDLKKFIVYEQIHNIYAIDMNMCERCVKIYKFFAHFALYTIKCGIVIVITFRILEHKIVYNEQREK